MSQHHSGCSSSPARAPPETRGCAFPTLEFGIVSFPGVFSERRSHTPPAEEVGAGRISGVGFGVSNLSWFPKVLVVGSRLNERE